MMLQSDQPGHEGYLRGYVSRDTNEVHRELGQERDRDLEEWSPPWIAMGCACGWRSPRWRPHSPARWVPSVIWADPLDEEIGRVLWQAHERQSGPCVWSVFPSRPPSPFEVKWLHSAGEMERAAELAHARVHGPSADARIAWTVAGGFGEGVVKGTSLRDRQGFNTTVTVDGGGEVWIDSRTIIAIRRGGGW